MDDLLPPDFSTRLQNKSTPLSALKRGSGGSRSASTHFSSPGASNDDLNGLKGPHRTSSLSSSSMPVYDDDVFGCMFGSGSMSGHVPNDDLLGGGTGSYGGFDDLISGFHRQSESAKTTVSSSEDPFAIFETSFTTNPSVFADTLDNLGKTRIHSPEFSTSPYETNATSSDLFSRNYSHPRTTHEAFFTMDEIPLFTKPSKAPPSLRPPPPPGTKLESYGNNNLNSKGKDQYSRTSTSGFDGMVRAHSASQIDELEEFARSRPRPSGDDLVTKKASERKEKLDREREAREREKNKLGKRREMENRNNTQQTKFMDDLIFGFGGSDSGEEFQEFEGESEDRRRARLERHLRTHERTKQALAEKQERDMQTQMEQEEKHRINETLDTKIRSWAAGKEGNLRALLSTLQHILWPECGWQAVSLTDLITSAAVKKVYRKATLNLHPDKLHRANLQQKCIGEKVFDILKEAYNKFNSEEL